MKPEIRMVSFTEEPLLKIFTSFYSYHHNLPPVISWAGYEDIGVSRKQIVDTVEGIFKQPHQGSLEFVEFTFHINNVTRAFTHQIVRNRVASFAQQSQRVVDMGAFFDKGYFRVPPKIKGDEEALDVYNKTMRFIQDSYKKLSNMGISAEDARGLLPTNVGTCIMWHMNYRSLRDTMKVRLCRETQDENRAVMLEIKRLVTNYEPVLGEQLVSICDMDKQCHSIWTKCGKHPWTKDDKKESWKDNFAKEKK